MMHDYHLYTCPAIIRKQRPDAFLHHFVHIPWTHTDAWRVLPADIRTAIFEGLLANDIIGFHTRTYCNNFLQCCRELMGLDTDFRRQAVMHGRPRDVGAPLSARDRRRERSSASPPAPGSRRTRRRSCAAAATT